MIKGFAEKEFAKLSWAIGLIDEQTNIAYTFELNVHEATPEGQEVPFTSVLFKHEGVLIALSEALQKLELFPRDANKAELEATKNHLGDLRKIAFHELGVRE